MPTASISNARSEKTCWVSFLLVVMLLGGSLRAVFKYLPAPTFVSLGMFCGGWWGYALLISRAKNSSLSRLFLFRKPRLLCACLILAIAAASYVIYPLADARRNLGAGSTADDAIIQASQTFCSSGSMYSATLPGGIPISPGPGWVLLNLPLANSQWYWLISPGYIVLALLVFSKLSASARQSAFVLCLLSSSLLFWELLTTGSDLVAVGFALAALTVATWKLSQNPTPGLAGPIAVGVLAGMVATSRVVFAAFPLLLALFAWKSSRKASLLVAGLGVLTVAGLHAYFFCSSDNYQPFHLFGRGRSNVGYDFIALGLVAEVLAVTYAYRHTNRRGAEWLCGVWLCLFVPLFLISIGELRAVSWNFARWEGANYLFPCIPAYLFYVATTVFEPQNSNSIRSSPKRVLGKIARATSSPMGSSAVESGLR